MTFLDAAWAVRWCRRRRQPRKLRIVAARTHRPARPYPAAAVGYVILAVAVIGSVAAGVGLLAARLPGAGGSFAVALTATVLCGLVSGALAGPGLRRRIGQAATRSRTGHGSPSP